MAPTTDPGASEPDAPEPAEAETARTEPTLLEQMGGVSGLIYSTVPVAVFVPANSIGGLGVAIGAALAAALVVFGIRLIRREGLMPAVSGLLGVAICAFIAHRTGDAKGYFLFGIWSMLAYAVACVVSILVRWPLIGVAWHLVTGEGTAWRRNRAVLRAYDLATACWAVVFGARYLTQSALYDSDHTGWLAAARIGMGWPLTALAAVVTVYLVRRATRSELLDDRSGTE
ncbi:DUF3159 domain-containing protein [Gordonia sp. (in: high G+C Gram-positive bacteria)]|jgi:hypothetical protein|uniref:DUF3159 domain-containing protein n=1 Tax=Gordonia sp. (in: high G+C Gram-positive bacteria) TaxID=84139 RepID=UPI001D390451|nr:DUF3159 domain-containing protein [Gordonia sp. (in: high G+C Gram-positive bacteria)]MCB1293489.1 DUF3159 domain-containing protein [Gordonia sp. (in: high G+C Gram-positive bacteria)]HMS76654.1 DUF3159 domain-containing protein [Gordonia sp. (in: high G+C Gram-positive bacteria)]